MSDSESSSDQPSVSENPEDHEPFEPAEPGGTLVDDDSSAIPVRMARKFGVPRYFELLKKPKDFKRLTESLSAEVEAELDDYSSDEEKKIQKSGKKCKAKGECLEDLSPKDLKQYYKLVKGEYEAGNDSDELKDNFIEVLEELFDRKFIKQDKFDEWMLKLDPGSEDSASESEGSDDTSETSSENDSEKS